MLLHHVYSGGLTEEKKKNQQSKSSSITQNQKELSPGKEGYIAEVWKMTDNIDAHNCRRLHFR